MKARLSWRLRLALFVLLLVWFFSPPAIRDEVPLWLPFLVALGLELHFLAVNWRSTEPFFERHDPAPGPDDRQRYGDEHVPEWAIVESARGGRVWVDLAAPEAEEDAGDDPARRESGRAPARSLRSRGRRMVWPLAEAIAVLAVVAGVVLLLDRGDWGDLGRETRVAAEERFSVEASRIVGRPVHVGCDTEGDHVGVVQHADGVAEVGGTRAYLTPELCYALYRLAFDGDVDAFGTTARAISVLAHEAWHLRGEANEGLTECYALQSGVELGRRLGLSEDDARRMMRSRLVQNDLFRRTDGSYLVPQGCSNRGRYDLHPSVDRFP